MKIKKVILSGVFSFPAGSAASSRITNLALGFSDHVQDVEIVCAYHHNGEQAFVEKGMHIVKGKKIAYRTVAPFQHQTTSLSKRLQLRLKFFKVIQRLVELTVNELTGDADELLFLYGRSYLFLNALIRQIRNKGYKTVLVFDVVEPPRVTTHWIEYLFHPFVFDSVMVFNRLLPVFHSCTFITYKLEKEYGSQVRHSQIIPAVMYDSSLMASKLQDRNKLKIGYLGSLINKDYPELLYNVLLKLYERSIPFELHVIGRFRFFAEGRAWEKKFNKSPFKASVRFHFNPDDSERDALISVLDYLALFRKPERLQEFTFPTRAVEFLNHGKVLLINNYGELAKYFQHRKTAIVINPVDINRSITDWQKLSNPVNFQCITEQCKFLLHDTFNSSHQCKKLLESFNV